MLTSSNCVDIAGNQSQIRLLSFRPQAAINAGSFEAFSSSNAAWYLQKKFKIDLNVIWGKKSIFFKN